MKLYLVQHGEAVAKNIDPGRPLSRQGEHDVQRMAGFLKKCNVALDKIMHSGKMRAHQTAEILAEAVLIKGEIEAVKGVNPDDPVEDFSIVAHKLKQDTMVVGHLPFMSRMVSYLITGNPDQAVVAYKPGSIVCLERNAEQYWQIQWMLRPNFLPRD